MRFLEQDGFYGVHLTDFRLWRAAGARAASTPRAADVSTLSLKTNGIGQMGSNVRWDASQDDSPSFVPLELASQDNDTTPRDTLGSMGLSQLMIASQADMPADSQMAPTQELTPLGMHSHLHLFTSLPTAGCQGH